MRGLTTTSTRFAAAKLGALALAALAALAGIGGIDPSGRTGTRAVAGAGALASGGHPCPSGAWPYRADSCGEAPVAGEARRVRLIALDAGLPVPIAR